MIRYLATIAAIIFAFSFAAAQEDTADDRSYLERFLEENLSGAGRDVRIVGFTGALSSQAQVEQITIADDEGVWLILRGVSLNWTRSALFSGRLKVDTLAANEIRLERLPVTSSTASLQDTAAKPFALPELPISVEIGHLEVKSLTIDAAVSGEDSQFTLLGNVSLIDGQGIAHLEVKRTDKPGRFDLSGSFDNESRILKLSSDLEEAEGGIVTHLLGIPGRPALQLDISGEDPISDFSAAVQLSTAGDVRLTGTVAIKDEPSSGESILVADINGNLAPLIQPDFRPFFEGESRLRANGSRSSDGGFSLSQFSLSAAMLQLDGSLELNPDGWPIKFDLDGRLEGDNPVRLPVPGTVVEVERATIAAKFNAELRDEWVVEAAFHSFVAGDLKIDNGILNGKGRISLLSPNSFTALTSLILTGVSHADQGLSQALGNRISGNINVSRTQHSDALLNIYDIELQSNGLTLRGAGKLDVSQKGVPVSGSVHLRIPRLDRFSDLSGRKLSGVATVLVSGTADLLSGAFDLILNAHTDGLETGVAKLDNLTASESRLSIQARRDTTGIELTALDLSNEELTTRATGRLGPQAAHLQLSADLRDLAAIDNRLNGPATFETRLRWRENEDLFIEEVFARLADAQIQAEGQLTLSDPDIPVSGKVSASIPALSRFAEISHRPISGNVDLNLTGQGTLKGHGLNIHMKANGSNLATGNADLDRLIGQRLEMEIEGGRDESFIDIRQARVETSQVNFAAKGNGPGKTIDVSVNLKDIGQFVPNFSGSANATGNVTLENSDASDLAVDLTASGPGGTKANVAGNVRKYGRSLDLALVGSAPLALVNRFITPRSLQGTANYNLKILGAPAMASLSGIVETSDGQLALPRLKTALRGIAGSLRISAQRAAIDMSGRFRDGGQLTTNGQVNLTNPYSGDLKIKVSDFILTDGSLYKTTGSADVVVAGPLIGGARVEGDVNLKKTELRIPSGPAAETIDMPGLQHANEPIASRVTRQRAGLIKNPGASRASSEFPIDLTIKAPAQVYVRGRGLDAELGGKLTLHGTTANVVPSGQVELIRGRFDILGKRLELTEGLIDLRGALDPFVRFVAETSAEDTLVRIVLMGLASDPEITFESDPELPQEEVVSRLLFGRGLENISPFQAAQLASAVATLAGRSDNDIVGRLRNTVGLSDLDVTSGEDDSTEVSAGAYISENIYSEITADSEGKREIHLNLDISPAFTIKGRADNEGDTGLGLYFEKDY